MTHNICHLLWPCGNKCLNKWLQFMLQIHKAAQSLETCCLQLFCQLTFSGGKRRKQNMEHHLTNSLAFNSTNDFSQFGGGFYPTKPKKSSLQTLIPSQPSPRKPVNPRVFFPGSSGLGSGGPGGRNGSSGGGAPRPSHCLGKGPRFLRFFLVSQKWKWKEMFPKDLVDVLFLFFIFLVGVLPRDLVCVLFFCFFFGWGGASDMCYVGFFLGRYT